VDDRTAVKKRPDLLAGEDLPSDPRQRRSVDKRERLKEAGLGLFGEKGYESTSIEAIAQRASLAVESFYQHYRSKRQLLLALMDELLERLSQLEFRTEAAADTRAVIRGLLSRSFAHDLRYLGAYRAWQEAALAEAGLARKQKQIHAWTTARVTAVFERLAQLPGARKGLDLAGLARGMDALFWSLLGQVGRMPKPELERWVESCTHLIYHALFTDSPNMKK
jgi:AcrR family transcriptional regulator